MQKIKNHHLAQLLMQLKFTSLEKRRRQVNSAEKLLDIIDCDKEYPFDFVCFKITGYHPKGLPGELINGAELADDLRIFTWKLSGQVAQPVSQRRQKVYTAEELAKFFGISTKTIERWRKKGLVARKFIFNDGKKRAGFLKSGVDKFLDKNPDLIAKAKTFRRLTKKEKAAIVKRAKTLCAKGTLSRYQIINRISAKRGKAHETVRYVLANYEKANPSKPISKEPSGLLDSATASEIYRLYKQGCTIDELTGRFGRGKSSIYRIINRRRARAVLAKKIEFVESDEFLQADAGEKILEKPAAKIKSGLTGGIEPLKLIGSSLSEYLQTLKNTTLLNREREVELFRRYNYLKYLACIVRADVKLAKVSGTLIRKVENYSAQAETIKKMIIEANLRLVVSIARKHTISGLNLQELISEGNFSLIRAVEKFDYTRGFRFATFASWVIAKDFARKIPAEKARTDKAKTEFRADIQRDLRTAEASGIVAVERARQSLVQVIKNELDDREQYIILNHFGLLGTLVKKEKKTLREIGEDLELTRERVRQIELGALQKLKYSLSIEEFELLTG